MRHYNPASLNTLGGSIVLAEFDRSRYILVPYVSAIKEDGSSGINGYEYANWRDNYSGLYPHITAVTAVCWYKQNFNSTAATRMDRGINLLSSSPKQVSYEYLRNNDMINTKRRSGTVLAVKSSLNVLPGSIGGVTFQVTSSGGSVFYRATVAEATALNLPFYYLSFAPGVLGEETGNHPPHLYYSVDSVMNALAQFGVVVAEGYADMQNYHGRATDSSVKVHIPGIDQNGYITDTMFAPGTSGADNFFNNWETGGNTSIYLPLGGFDLTGSTSVDPDVNPPLTPLYEDVQDPSALPPGSPEMGLTAPTYNGVGMFASYFCTSYAGLLHLQQNLWTLSDNVLVELVESLRLFSDPIQAIVSLRMYPFNIYAHVPGCVSSEVKLGKVTIAEANAGFLKIPSNSTVTFDMGSFYIQGRYKNFLDLAPYTTMNLFIPFVGNIDLNINDFLNHTLRVQLTVDLTTGSCLAAVYADGILMVNATGQMGVDIPVTSADNAEISSRIFNAFIGMAINAGGSFITQSIGGVNNSGVGNIHRAIAGAKEGLANVDTSSVEKFNDTVVDSLGDIFLGKTSMDRVGSSSPGNSFYLPTYCFITISQPTFEKPANFDHTYGRPCHTSGQLASFTGFTKCNNVDVSNISALEYEKLSIKNLLESGVYL